MSDSESTSPASGAPRGTSGAGASGAGARRMRINMIGAILVLVLAGGAWGVMRWRAAGTTNEPLVDVYDPVRGGSNYPRINNNNNAARSNRAATTRPLTRPPTTRPRAVPPVQMPAPSGKPV